MATLEVTSPVSGDRERVLASATTYLVPPIAILLGWLLLGEAPPALAVVGGGLCLAGVFVAQRR